MSNDTRNGLQNFKFPKCALPHTQNIKQKVTDTWNKYFDTFEAKKY